MGGVILIRYTTTHITQNMNNYLPPFATIRFERGEDNTFLPLEEGILEQIMNFPEVVRKNQSNLTTLFSEELYRAPVPHQAGMRSTPESLEFESMGIRVRGYDFDIFTELRGVDNEVLFDEEIGLISLMDGRHFTSEELAEGASVVWVSADFALTNELRLGDKFNLENKVWDWRYLHENDPFNFSMRSFEWDNLYRSETIEFEVIGIFEPQVEFIHTMDNSFQMLELHSRLLNRIYLPNEKIQKIQEFQAYYLAQVTPDWERNPNVNEWVNHYFSSHSSLIIEDRTNFQFVLQLRNMGNLDSIRQEIDELLPDFWVVEDFSEDFSIIIASTETLEWLFDIILYSVIGGGILISCLLFLLLFMGRKHEIGIYLSLGLKKYKIFLQFFVEMGLVVFVSISLSLIGNFFFANNLSHSLLRREIYHQQEQEVVDMMMVWDGLPRELRELGFYQSSNVDAFWEIFEASFTKEVVFLFYGAMATTLVGSLAIPYFYFLKLNPKKLLM